MCTTSNVSGALTLSHAAASDITDAMICAVAGNLSRAISLDQTEVLIGAVDLRITATGGTTANTRGIMYISYIKA